MLEIPPLPTTTMTRNPLGGSVLVPSLGHLQSPPPPCTSSLDRNAYKECADDYPNHPKYSVIRATSVLQVMFIPDIIQAIALLSHHSVHVSERADVERSKAVSWKSCI